MHDFWIKYKGVYWKCYLRWWSRNLITAFVFFLDSVNNKKYSNNANKHCCNNSCDNCILNCCWALIRVQSNNSRFLKINSVFQNGVSYNLKEKLKNVCWKVSSFRSRTFQVRVFSTTRIPPIHWAKPELFKNQFIRPFYANKMLSDRWAKSQDEMSYGVITYVFWEKWDLPGCNSLICLKYYHHIRYNQPLLSLLRHL